MSAVKSEAGNAAKDEILRRIRAALTDVSPGEHPGEVSVERDYRLAANRPRNQIIAEFCDRVTEYRAIVHQIASAALREAITAACSRQHVLRLVTPSDVPDTWLPDNVEILRDEPEQSLTKQQLDGSDGVLTGCALAIAQTGSIALDGGRAQGRRALSLLPDYHLCVVFEYQVVGLVPEAIGPLGDTVRQTGRPITLISGPSATSDIEFNRIEGVHGPRNLEIVLVRSSPVELAAD